MAKYIIKGGNPLYGEVKIQGAKNSVLPLLSASVLCEGETIIENVPRLKDVDNMLKILKVLGVKTQRDGDSLMIDAKEVVANEIPSTLSKELRSSIFLLGPLLARRKRASVAYPGGCDIGLRPIDLHLKALREMGVEIKEEGGMINCSVREGESCAITFDYPSVGATENAILLATAINGVVSLANCATEPEIEDLQNFINAMGGSVSGAGTPFIKIKGGIPLKGTKFRTMSDRIEAGTYLVASLLCGGEVLLSGAREEHLSSLISKISKWDCKIGVSSGKIHITSNGKVGDIGEIQTLPYPGFPTDLQAIACVLASVAKGKTTIVENLFESRFKQVPELIKMGARVSVKDRVATFEGVESLHGADVYAEDLRGGASLVVAGLIAKGTTTVNNVHFIERGYEDLDAKLRLIGAEIKKV